MAESSLADRVHSPRTAEGDPVFIDLDGLKHINDTCGHDIGDAAIRMPSCSRVRIAPQPSATYCASRRSPESA